jgi:hypothetical protein
VKLSTAGSEFDPQHGAKFGYYEIVDSDCAGETVLLGSYLCIHDQLDFWVAGLETIGLLVIAFVADGGQITVSVLSGARETAVAAHLFFSTVLRTSASATEGITLLYYFGGANLFVAADAFEQPDGITVFV